jgi:L-lysine 6-transaminase
MTAVFPENVHEVLRRSILVDGYAFVQDLDASHGSWLVDAISGQEWLDFGSGYASTALTFDHPALRDPAFEQKLLRVARHKPANGDRYTVELAEFVDTVATQVIPPSHPHLFFIEGGAPAVENALKVAFDWKVRKNLAAGKPEGGNQVIHFAEAFHGRLGYSLSLTNTTDPRKHMYFPKFAWPRFDPPKLRFPVTDEVLREVAATEQRVLGEIEAYLQRHGDDVAAILIEPLQGEGGDNHFRREFFQGLRDLADRYEALLIFDEVQTGMGLTGSWWLFQQIGVEPDVFAFAKKMQLGGLAANRRVDEVPNNVFAESSRINSTWGGCLTDMVRAQRIIETIVADDLLENAKVQGERLMSGLREMEAAGLIGNTRGVGLMIAFDMPDGATRDRVVDAAYDQHLLVLACGPRSVRLRPFLDVGTADVEEFFNKVEPAVRRVVD